MFFFKILFFVAGVVVAQPEDDVPYQGCQFYSFSDFFCKLYDNCAFYNKKCRYHKMKAFRVLLIGNSMIHTNDVPGQISKMSHLAGLNVQVYESTFGAATFGTHLKNTKTLQMLNSHYDVVVLHEQSKFLSFPRYIIDLWSLPYAKILDQKIDATKILLFSTPAYRYGNPTSHTNNIDTHADMQRRQDDGYKYIRENMSNRTTVAYVGEFYNRSNLDLWQYDGIHPNIAGSYIAARVIFKEIFNISTSKYRPRKLSLRTKKYIDKLFM